MSRNSLRQYFLSVIKLMRPFKWYMTFNGAYLFLLVFEYLNPPAKDDPIFGSVSTLDAWNYVNQEVYVESLKLAVIIFVLLFLLATSNMRNHPKIAKCLFLFPWLDMALGMAAQIISDIL